MTHPSDRLRPVTLFLAATALAAVSAGCAMQAEPVSSPAQPPGAAAAPGAPAAQPAAPASSAAAIGERAVGRPAAVPATGPATPDPREAQFLTDVTQLTTGFDRAGEGYFSPDMNWVIFQATPKGEKEYQMYVAPLEVGDGSAPKLGAPTRVSPPNSRNTCGYFSPDGKTILFGSTAGKEKPDEPSPGYQRQGGNYRWAFPDGMEIYAATWPLGRVSAAQPDVDALANNVPASFYHLLKSQDLTRETFHAHQGAQPTQTWLTADQAGSQPTQVDLAKPDNRLTNNDGYDAEGSYSPDGKWITFTSRRTGDTEVWVMRADGSNSVQITNSKHYDGGPFFAPDGKRLIYRSDRKGNDLLQVFVAELAFDDAGTITGLKSEKQITDDANVNWGPYFHPDNKHVLYATSQHGHHNYELYLMRDDGSNKTRVTYAGFDGLPVFSPDGKHAMWSAKGRTKDNTTQLFIARFRLPAE